MRWSLSEFLNLVELRSQTWCIVQLGAAGGFSVPHSEGVLFYAVLEGSAKIARTGASMIELKTEEIVLLLSGEAHAVRGPRGGKTQMIDFLNSGAYADTPPTIAEGESPIAARLLCGRLKPRWPAGQRPQTLPAILRIDATESVINLQALEQTAQGEGANAVLTRAANLLFATALRRHPDCAHIFEEAASHDPIARAQQFIETHPFTNWTVEILASKVGIGRSNLAARFVAETGKTPFEALTEERMKHAARLIQETDMKLAAIGERIGYKSEAAFSRRFSARFGVTPSQMRKQAREVSRR